MSYNITLFRSFPFFKQNYSCKTLECGWKFLKSVSYLQIDKFAILNKENWIIKYSLLWDGCALSPHYPEKWNSYSITLYIFIDMESLPNLDTVSTKFNDFVFVRIQVIIKCVTLRICMLILKYYSYLPSKRTKINLHLLPDKKVKYKVFETSYEVCKWLERFCFNFKLFWLGQSDTVIQTC